MKLIGVWVIAGLLSSPAFGLEFGPRFDQTWSRARLLKAGDSRFTFSGVRRESRQIFGPAGKVQDFGSAYSYNLSWSEALATEPNQARVQKITRALHRSGVALSEPSAQISFKVQSKEKRFAFSWSYGLTKRWMLGARLPLILATTEVSSHVIEQPSLKAIKAHAATSNDPELNQSLKVFGSQIRARELQSLRSRGHTNLAGIYETQYLGDAEMLSQWLVADSDGVAFALQPSLVIPTATPVEMRSYVYQPSEDGQIDVGLKSIFDVKIFKNLQFSGSLGHVVQLPDKKSLFLTSDQQGGVIDHEVNRDLGDVSTFDLHAFWIPIKHWILSGGYMVRVKGADYYSAKSGTLEKPALHANRSEMQVARVGISYESKSLSTGLESRSWLVDFNSYQLIAGKGASADPYSSVAFSLTY